MPDEKTLRRAYAELTLRVKLKAAEKRLRTEPAPALTPAIMDQLHKAMDRQPDLSWDQALYELASGETK